MLGLQLIERHPRPDLDGRVRLPGELLWQIGQRDRVAVRQDHRPLDHVAQFAQVARPRVGPEGGGHLGGEPLHPLAQMAAEKSEIVARQTHEIGRAVPQAGQCHHDDVEPVEQIGAKTAGLHFGEEVAVAGGDHPHRRAARARFAHPLVLPVLEEAQQLGLDLQRHFADLVEEECATLSRRHLAKRVLHRVREGALHVAEQLALQQFARQARAADGDERPFPLRAAPVDFAGQHVLARAARAE